MLLHAVFTNFNNILNIDIYSKRIIMMLNLESNEINFNQLIYNQIIDSYLQKKNTHGLSEHEYDLLYHYIAIEFNLSTKAN